MDYGKFKQKGSTVFGESVREMKEVQPFLNVVTEMRNEK